MTEGRWVEVVAAGPEFEAGDLERLRSFRPVLSRMYVAGVACAASSEPPPWIPPCFAAGIPLMAVFLHSLLRSWRLRLAERLYWARR